MESKQLPVLLDILAFDSCVWSSHIYIPLEALWDSLMNPNLCMPSIEKTKRGEGKFKKVEG